MVTSLMLRVPLDVLDQAKNEILLQGYTALQLADELDLAVQLVENFLNGEVVDRNTYELVCEKLNLPLDIYSETSIEDIPVPLLDSYSMMIQTQKKKMMNKYAKTETAIQSLHEPEKAVNKTNRRRGRNIADLKKQ